MKKLLVFTLALPFPQGRGPMVLSSQSQLNKMKKLAALFAITTACMLMMAGCLTTPAADLAGCCCTDKGKACAKADVVGEGCGCPCDRCGKK